MAVIYVVTGHVCSGKSTHVREKSRPGDVIIDLDRIALALSHETTNHHEYPEYIRSAAMSARWGAIESAVKSHRQDGLGKRCASFDVWIIHAYPTESDLRMYARGCRSSSHTAGTRSTAGTRGST